MAEGPKDKITTETLQNILDNDKNETEIVNVLGRDIEENLDLDRTWNESFCFFLISLAIKHGLNPNCMQAY